MNVDPENRLLSSPGSRGIGRAIACVLAENGARVVIVDVDDRKQAVLPTKSQLRENRAWR
jgi:NAD(P)-dependent dehydrogenase (short-subunit alcohol dehydrogenase family)